LLKNPDAAWDHPAITQVRRGPAASPYMGYSIRTDKWRYTEWEGGKRGAELYDEIADPQETRNLVMDPQHRRVVSDLQRRLRRVVQP
jgi:uncharacterized sulfatase